MASVSTTALKGIIPPIATPLSGPDTLDIAGLERLVEHLVKGGVHGLFALGTTGEFASLSHRLQKELVQRTCEFAKGRLPVIVGVTDTSYMQTVELAQFAAEQGAEAVVLSTPYYVPLSQPELVEYVESILPELPLPVYLYSIPSFTKVTIEPATVRLLMHHEKIIGMKDSSGDLNRFQHYVDLLPQRPDWSLLMGPEELVAEGMRLGCHGGVCGGANLFPSLYVELYEAALRGDAARVAELQERVMLISTKLYRVGAYGSAFLKSIKCSLGLLGICDDHLAPPLSRFGEPDRAKVAAVLRELGTL